MTWSSFLPPLCSPVKELVWLLASRIDFRRTLTVYLGEKIALILLPNLIPSLSFLYQRAAEHSKITMDNQLPIIPPCKSQ